jgi:hypothetical protein
MFTSDDFAYFAVHGFSFPFGTQPITGHIVLLQLRAGYQHILDYKPDAAKETHAVTQLTIYAMALSRRTGLPVKAFTCAGFDERDYCECYPLPSISPRTHARRDNPRERLVLLPRRGTRLSPPHGGPRLSPMNLPPDCLLLKPPQFLQERFDGEPLRRLNLPNQIALAPCGRE